MTRRQDVPEFGLLSGVKVAFSAVSIAGPFFASLCADNGADVIWLENAKVPSIDRSGDGLLLAQDRKNMRNLALDIPSPEGREVFLDILKDVDIFLEASKGGQYAKWGLTDEVLWEANPKLVIIHLSGFGQQGDPGYVRRASYDPIGQAFSGMMYANTVPGEVPTPAYPLIADYYAGFLSFGTALAAYIKAQKTGKGESADITQYETAMRCMSDLAMKDWNYPEGDARRFVPGVKNSNTAGYNAFLCGDGNYVFMLIFGQAVMRGALPVFGLEYGSDETPIKHIYWDYEPEGKILNKAIEEYCSQHTAEEVEAALTSVNAPCIRMLKFEQMLEHPHYQARNSVITARNPKGEEVRISGIIPKVKNSPGKIWCQPPTHGLDNEDILADLGYSSEKIAKLYEAGIVQKKGC
jgi:L-carnitine CoA-transferase